MNKDLDERQKRGMAIIIAYPLILIGIATTINIFVFGISPYIFSTPSQQAIWAYVVSAVLLTINHTWIMTATELTRARFRMYASPEEWASSGTSREDIPNTGILELERTHNTHRNTTENTVYFIMLSIAFICSTPTEFAETFWLIGFSVARLGYTASYLKGSDTARGIFMTISLVTLYGIASYLLISLASQ